MTVKAPPDLLLIGSTSTMNEFKVGDRVRILSGATHFVGVEGIIGRK
jgi:hypothetical protein